MINIPPVRGEATVNGQTMIVTIYRYGEKDGSVVIDDGRGTQIVTLNLRRLVALRRAIQIVEDQIAPQPSLPLFGGAHYQGSWERLPTVTEMTRAVLRIAEQPLPLREVLARVQRAIPTVVVSKNLIAQALSIGVREGQMLRHGASHYYRYEWKRDDDV